ncbi:uncharacterized protein [Littorina saxatilis]|uniref:Uncharacterized protein n=1 Tax=Littorina saxatilis TaxID=31220 RepID=A0AAN9GBJ6_9CAEN
MGSGFSGCTGASSVGVTEVGGKQSLNKSGGGVHSDSCDSGISIGDGNKKSRSSYRHTATSRHVAGELDSEEEMMVAGSEVGCGTDFLMTSTPRAGATTTTASTTKLADVAEHPDTMSPSHTSRKSRNAHSRSRTSSLRHNPNSAPNLLEHAIHEEDEDAFDGEPEDKRLRAQRPPRPKSAHFKKSRAGNSQRGRTARSRQLNQHVGSASGGDSSAEVTSDEGEDDFDSDILSIPDETSPHVTRPNTLTTIRLGPQFQAQTKIQDHDGHGNDKNEDMDWWAEDDGGSTARTSRDGGRDSSRSRASSSFTLRSHSRVWPEGRVAKKASERSISSILLTTAVELDSSPATAATNPACFAVTNPEITQHILKVSTSMQATTIAPCMRNLIDSSSSTSIPPVATLQTHVKNHDRARSRSGSASNAKSLNQKLHDICVVKPAKEPVKGPEPCLEQKLRDLFCRSRSEDPGAAVARGEVAGSEHHVLRRV